MVREEFIKQLENGDIEYNISGDNIIVSGHVIVFWDYVEIPDNVTFTNNGSVSFYKGSKIGDNVVFNNQITVNMFEWVEFTGRVEFNNLGSVHIGEMGKITNKIKFNNKGYVNIRKGNPSQDFVNAYKDNSESRIYLGEVDIIMLTFEHLDYNLI